MNIRKAVKAAIDKNDYKLLLDAYQEDSGQVLRNLQLHVFGLQLSQQDCRQLFFWAC